MLSWKSCGVNSSANLVQHPLNQIRKLAWCFPVHLAELCIWICILGSWIWWPYQWGCLSAPDIQDVFCWRPQLQEPRWMCMPPTGYGNSRPFHVVLTLESARNICLICSKGQMLLISLFWEILAKFNPPVYRILLCIGLVIGSGDFTSSSWFMIKSRVHNSRTSHRFRIPLIPLFSYIPYHTQTAETLEN